MNKACLIPEQESYKNYHQILLLKDRWKINNTMEQIETQNY